MNARWDGAPLLQPITADRPCGDCLEDTPLLASFDAFRLFGQAAPFDPPPPWNQIRDSALRALQASKDLRLLAHLGSALLRTDGLPAFAQTLSVASQWLTQYWSQLYPQIDEDAIVRRNALNCFADPMAVIDGLRRAPLVSSRQHGTFSLRDIDLASGHVQPTNGEPKADDAQINAAFAAMPLDDLVLMQESAAGSLAALKQVDAVMRDAGGTAAAPDLDPLVAHLGRIDRVLRAQLAARPDAAHADTPGTTNGSGAAVAVGAISSRQDAIRALDAVALFFRQTEPSSPVPLFVDRAKRLIAKDFLEVLADVAPDALAQARAAGGVSERE